MNTLSIRTDLMSNAIQQNLSYSTDKFNQSMQRLASGLKINSAKDGAANLNISTKMGSTISGLAVANSNINTGISTLSTVNSTYDLITTELQKVRDLAIQASNGTYSAEDYAAINEESNQLIAEVNRLIKKSNSSLQTSEESTGFIDYVDKMSEADAIKAGYTQSQIIHSASEFVSKISSNLSGNFILVNDLDMSELGTLTNSAITGNFTGKLDGNRCVINNLTIDTKNSAAVYSAGLFSQLGSTAEIKNLGLSNLNITALASMRAGGIVGYDTGSKIANCYATGNITGAANIGLCVGTKTGGSIINSYSGGTSTGTASVGGLIGSCVNISLSNSYSCANVKSSGENWGAGGLIGGSTSSQITTAKATGKVEGTNGVGGLIGSTASTNITYSYATGSVLATASASGGLIGQLGTSSSVDYSYATGAVSGPNMTGGLVGRMTTSTVTRAYSSGFISGTASGSSFLGGFIGRLFSGTANISDYWDIQTSGRTTSSGGAVGVTTVQLNALIAQRTWDGAGYKSGKTNEIVLQTGTEKEDTYTIKNLKIDIDLSEVDLSDATKASNSLNIIDTSLDTITAQSTSLGSTIKMLENKIDVNNTQSINTTQANSTLKDADTAEETIQLVQQQILQQTNAYLLNENRGRLKEILLDLINQGG